MKALKQKEKISYAAKLRVAEYQLLARRDGNVM